MNLYWIVLIFINIKEKEEKMMNENRKQNQLTRENHRNQGIRLYKFDLSALFVVRKVLKNKT